ncbi:MAG: hypothetical protein LBP73_11750 [Clostridiales Family XIII bacterium]|nr:hypothetical protein [Clostridiales Family XIII bacterium]
MQKDKRKAKMPKRAPKSDLTRCFLVVFIVYAFPAVFSALVFAAEKIGVLQTGDLGNAGEDILMLLLVLYAYAPVPFAFFYGAGRQIHLEKKHRLGISTSIVAAVSFAYHAIFYGAGMNSLALWPGLAFLAGGGIVKVFQALGNRAKRDSS